MTGLTKDQEQDLLRFCKRVMWEPHHEWPDAVIQRHLIQKVFPDVVTKYDQLPQFYAQLCEKSRFDELSSLIHFTLLAKPADEHKAIHWRNNVISALKSVCQKCEYFALTMDQQDWHDSPCRQFMLQMHDLLSESRHNFYDDLFENPLVHFIYIHGDYDLFEKILKAKQGLSRTTCLNSIIDLAAPIFAGYVSCQLTIFDSIVTAVQPGNHEYDSLVRSFWSPSSLSFVEAVERIEDKATQKKLLTSALLSLNLDQVGDKKRFLRTPYGSRMSIGISLILSALKNHGVLLENLDLKRVTDVIDGLLLYGTESPIKFASEENERAFKVAMNNLFFDIDPRDFYSGSASPDLAKYMSHIMNDGAWIAITEKKHRAKIFSDELGL